MARLKKELGLVQVTLAGIGIILGAGIYALIGVAAGNGGNAIWLSFLLSAIVAIFTGLSYAELSSMFKSDAGEYDYVNEAINSFFARGIGISMIIAAIIAAATVSLGFAGYIYTLFPLNILVYAGLILLCMTLINYKGIKETSWFNSFATIIELLGLLIIIVLGLFHIGEVNYFEMPQGFSGVLSSAALVFFAFIGFESIVKLREETKNADTVIPKAVIYSVFITSVLYVLVAFAAISIVGWETLSTSDAPLATVAAAALGSSS
ncbi:MAG: APC family permease, partial [Nanoarchaeota archaeon]